MQLASGVCQRNAPHQNQPALLSKPSAFRAQNLKRQISREIRKFSPGASFLQGFETPVPSSEPHDSSTKGSETPVPCVEPQWDSTDSLLLSALR